MKKLLKGSAFFSMVSRKLVRQWIGVLGTSIGKHLGRRHHHHDQHLDRGHQLGVPEQAQQLHDQ
jgi:hypothetical protein